MHFKDIFKKVLITEKSELKKGIYVFSVDKRADKPEICAAVKALWGVDVAKINTVIMPRKNKRALSKGRGRFYKTASVKKAIFSLKSGQKLSFLDQESK